MKQRSNIVYAAIGVVVLIGLVLGVQHLTASKGPPLDYSLTQPTKVGLFRVVLEPEPGALTVGDIHDWTVTVTLPDGTPVNGATFTITGGMPAHSHGLPTAPQVTAELGSGRYTLGGVKFSMDGLWVLDITVTAGGKSDTAHFVLRV